MSIGDGDGRKQMFAASAKEIEVLEQCVHYCPVQANCNILSLVLSLTVLFCSSI